MEGVVILHHRCGARISTMYEGREIGYLTYTIDDGVLDIEHTVVDPSMRGKGIAGDMVRFCDGFCREPGLRIKASCSYAAHVLGIDDPNPSCRI